MTRFLDGPAAGTVLALKRAPLFLRAVRAVGAEWDALDQRKDRPEPDEAITLYRRAGDVHTVHVNMGRKGSGFYALAEYRVVEPQPDDATLRDQARFEAWAFEHAKDLTRR